MPRRRGAENREVVADPVYGSTLVEKFVCSMMWDGKKSTAERIMYSSLDIIETQTSRNPVDTLEQALHNVTPLLEVKPRRVGGATYQVPVEIRGDRFLVNGVAIKIKGVNRHDQFARICY